MISNSFLYILFINSINNYKIVNKLMKNSFFLFKNTPIFIGEISANHNGSQIILKN